MSEGQNAANQTKNVFQQATSATENLRQNINSFADNLLSNKGHKGGAGASDSKPPSQVSEGLEKVGAEIDKAVGNGKTNPNASENIS